VAAVDPVASMMAIPNPEFHAKAEIVWEKLKQAVEAV
jgi:hypothetical protein